MNNEPNIGQNFLKIEHFGLMLMSYNYLQLLSSIV